MDNTLYPSGEWVGYYTYHAKPTKCPMHLTLNFVRGNIRGAGIDNPGQFIIEGSYDDINFRAKWAKRYVGKHSVEYEGTYRDGEITGSWSLTQNNQGRAVSTNGEFRIWPLPVEQYGDDEPLQSILEKEIRRKP
jgi:hypothetical protein